MSIPIIGQVKVGEDWFLTMPMECPCGQHFLIAGQVGTVRPCPKCFKVYRIMRLPTADPVTNEVTWYIGTMKGEPPS